MTAPEPSTVVWRKSSRSFSNGDCVEVGYGAPQVHVRDTKDRGSGVVTFPGAVWRAFLTGIAGHPGS
jgi:hypothetical protein